MNILIFYFFFVFSSDLHVKFCAQYVIFQAVLKLRVWIFWPPFFSLTLKKTWNVRYWAQNLTAKSMKKTKKRKSKNIQNLNLKKAWNGHILSTKLNMQITGKRQKKMEVKIFKPLTLKFKGLKCHILSTKLNSQVNEKDKKWKSKYSKP